MADPPQAYGLVAIYHENVVYGKKFIYQKLLAYHLRQDIKRHRFLCDYKTGYAVS